MAVEIGGAVHGERHRPGWTSREVAPGAGVAIADVARAEPRRRDEADAAAALRRAC